MTNRRPRAALEGKREAKSSPSSELSGARGERRAGSSLVPLIRALARRCASELISRGISPSEQIRPSTSRHDERGEP